MKHKYQKLEFIAIITLICGVIFFIFPFLFTEAKIDFSSNIATIETLGNLGSYLSGTSGIFLTLASIIFLYISIKISFDSINDQKEEIIKQNKLQAIRDFESLFIFLCAEMENIKNNYLNGVETYNKEVKRIFKRFSYERDEEILAYIESGDLNIQVKEEQIDLNFDSLILHISNIFDVIYNRLSDENSNLRENYIRILSNKLSKEELRLLQIVSNTDLFDLTVVQNIKKLNFRYYERNEEQSIRKQEESRRNHEAMKMLRNSRI